MASRARPLIRAPQLRPCAPFAGPLRTVPSWRQRRVPAHLGRCVPIVVVLSAHHCAPLHDRLCRVAQGRQARRTIVREQARVLDARCRRRRPIYSAIRSVAVVRRRVPPSSCCACSLTDDRELSSPRTIVAVTDGGRRSSLCISVILAAYDAVSGLS